MNTKIYKQSMLKDVERNREYLDEVEAIITALPDELPDDVSVHAGGWGVYLDIPYNWEKYRQVRRCLRGWIPFQVLDDSRTGNKFYVLHPPDSKNRFVKLYITLKVDAPGSFCRAEVVGKEEVDIIKVVCE